MRELVAISKRDPNHNIESSPPKTDSQTRAQARKNTHTSMHTQSLSSHCRDLRQRWGVVASQELRQQGDTCGDLRKWEGIARVLRQWGGVSEDLGHQRRGPGVFRQQEGGL